MMTDKTKDGGPAFPLPVEDDRDCFSMANSGYGGMSLRDYFAAKAMQGQLAYGKCNDMSTDGVAAFAYAYADAMLAARSRNDD